MTSTSNSNSNSVVISSTTTTYQNKRQLTVEAFINKFIRVTTESQQEEEEEENNEQSVISSVIEIPAVIYFVVCQFYGRVGEYHVMASGKNEYGELGVGRRALRNATPLPALPALISDPSDVYVGSGRLIVKDADGHLYAAGYNEYGGCGIGSAKETISSFTAIQCDSSDPSKIVDGIQIVSTSTGITADHTLIVTVQNEMYSFGRNHCGQACLGMKTERNSTTHKKYYAQQVPRFAIQPFGDRRIKQIAVGWRHTLFLMADGAVFGCGSNGFSQLGLPSSNLRESLIPIHIPFTSSSKSNIIINQISAGGYHNLCADVDGNIYGFGGNRHSQLGFGDAFERKYYITHPTLHPFFNQSNHNRQILQIECAFSTLAVIDVDGNAFAFGSNMYGQIGNGKRGYQNVHQAKQVLCVNTNPPVSYYIDNPDSVGDLVDVYEDITSATGKISDRNKQGDNNGNGNVMDVVDMVVSSTLVIISMKMNLHVL